LDAVGDITGYLWTVRNMVCGTFTPPTAMLIW
jgi:hypothetical protein